VRKAGQLDEVLQISDRLADEAAQELATDEARERIRGHWKSMMSRAYDKRDPLWPRIGGEGTKVCPDWHEFETFCEWATDKRGGEPRRLMYRRDKGKDFQPGNVVFV
jgi:hypothetical protein